MNSKLPTGQTQPKSQILFQNKSPPQDINRSTLDLRGEMLPSEPINEAEVLEEEQENLIENGRELNIQYEKEIYAGKGQLISKCLFGVFNFFLKTNKNTLYSSKKEFIHSFFGRIHRLIICFRN